MGQYIKFPQEATDLNCYIPKVSRFVHYFLWVRMLQRMCAKSLSLPRRSLLRRKRRERRMLR